MEIAEVCAKIGTLPYAGSLFDQPGWSVRKLSAVFQEMAAWEKHEMDKMQREAPKEEYA